MLNRNLDGIYFRVQRDGKWQNICFTDLTDAEIQNLFHGEGAPQRSAEWWESMAMALRDVIRSIGDTFGIVGGLVE